jgi:hypothetical protein
VGIRPVETDLSKSLKLKHHKVHSEMSLSEIHPNHPPTRVNISGESKEWIHDLDSNQIKEETKEDDIDDPHIIYNKRINFDYQRQTKFKNSSIVSMNINRLSPKKVSKCEFWHHRSKTAMALIDEVENERLIYTSLKKDLNRSQSMGRAESEVIKTTSRLERAEKVKSNSPP